MNKEFIPYEQALELKELGFDENCIAFYEPDNKQVQVVGVEQRYNNPELLRMKDFCAPLYQQAFRWFREKKEAESLIKRYFTGSVDWVYGYEIRYLPKAFQNLKRPYDNLKYIESYKEGIGSYDGGWDTYEEAELACLKKLIEIIKNK